MVFGRSLGYPRGGPRSDVLEPLHTLIEEHQPGVLAGRRRKHVRLSISLEIRPGKRDLLCPAHFRIKAADDKLNLASVQQPDQLELRLSNPFDTRSDCRS